MTLTFRISPRLKLNSSSAVALKSYLAIASIAWTVWTQDRYAATEGSVSTCRIAPLTDLIQSLNFCPCPCCPWSDRSSWSACWQPADRHKDLIQMYSSILTKHKEKCCFLPF